MHTTSVPESSVIPDIQPVHRAPRAGCFKNSFHEKACDMTETTTLREQLQDFQDGFALRAAPERRQTMERATAKLRASGIEASALKAGDVAPDVTLLDARGVPTSLSSLWRLGPLVVVFYRGGWCPYCNLELRAWQALLPELSARGASLVAISPQTPDNSLSTAEKNTLAFPVLSDSALAAADAFGISFDMGEELVALYAKGGNDLPVFNGNGRWALPIPATYVVDTNGTIAYAHVEADYRKRAEPSEVLEHVRRA